MISTTPSFLSAKPVRCSVRAKRLRQSLCQYGLADVLEHEDRFAALLHMKIALIGNMNNNFFSLAQYLADIGVDVTLLLFSFELSHFDPHCDSYQESVRINIKKISWNNVIRADPDWLYREISEFDFTFCCGLAAAFMARVGLDIDVFLPYGDDLFEVPVHWHCEQDYKKYQDPSRYFFGKWQHKGLSRCRHFWISDHRYRKFIANQGYEGAISDIQSPFVYHRSYQGAPLAAAIQQSPYTETFKQLRLTHDLVIFHHSRQCWSDTSDPYDRKGNDVLLKGFAQFIKTGEAPSACLICFEYGSDVQASKDLIEELQITDHITWMPMMYRRDIMVGLSLCDIGAGNFDCGWRCGGAILEILMMGKPLVHYMEQDPENILPGTVFDFVQAKTPEEIAAFLADYVRRPAFYAELGERGRRWYHERSVDVTMTWCLRAFVDWARGHTSERGGKRREIRRLTERAAALERTLAELRADNRRSSGIAATLFGPAGPPWPTRDLSWHIRAGQAGRDLLGTFAPDEVIGTLKDHIRTVAERLGSDDEERPARAAPLDRALDRDIADLGTLLETDAALGELAAPLTGIVARGGWRAMLMGAVLRVLAASRKGAGG